jgi:hypothetical protein
MSQDTMERTFNVSSPARLVISNIRGSIEIVPGSENELHVSAVKYTDGCDSERTEIVMDQDADGTVRVTTRYQHGGLFFFGDRPCKVVYQVSVPQHCSVDCSGVSSSAFVQGLEGDFLISTVSGGVQVKDLVGPVRLNAVSGQVTGETISGPLDYETVSGNIRLVDSSLAHVRGTSVSASVWLQTALADGPYKFNTVSGSLYLLVPPGSACTVESHAISGSLVTDLPIDRDSRHGGYRHAEIAGGGPLVEFGGVSGNISVLSGEGGETQPLPVSQAAGGTQQGNPADTNEVLDKIERGEITVDEGIALLKKTTK